MGKKICIVCPHPEGVAPGQRLKYEQYIENWRVNGWQVDVYPFQSNRFWEINPKKGHFLEKIFWTFVGYFHRFLFLFQLRNYDITYIFLWVTPFGPPLFEWLYCKFAKKIIFDIDDLIFLGNASAANSWITKLKGKNKPIFLMKKANHVITTTPYLYDFCAQYNSTVSTIPPSLNENDIFPIKNSKNKILTIGWIGSHSTEPYLDIVKEALIILSKEIEFKIVLMGAKNFKADNIEIMYCKWLPENENDFLNKIDIALYPLRDELWSQGKYGGKLIQYFAAGLPTIVSDVNESNKLVLENNINGILVENTTEYWLNALRKLALDKLLRDKIGENARQDFLSKFSFNHISPIYLKILDSTIRN